MIEVLELMNIVMTKRQRDRLEISVSKNPRYEMAYKSVQKILHPYLEILDGWTEQSVTRSLSTFNNQNENLWKLIKDLLRNQIGDCKSFSRIKDINFF